MVEVTSSGPRKLEEGRLHIGENEYYYPKYPIPECEESFYSVMKNILLYNDLRNTKGDQEDWPSGARSAATGFALSDFENFIKCVREREP